MTTLDQQWADLYASGRVRWMAGMMTADGWRVIEDDDRDEPTVCRERTAVYLSATELGAPDWSDPATIGCLLQQARQAWGEPGTSPQMTIREGRLVWKYLQFTASNEPAAILAAIAAAPPRSKP